MEIYSEVEGGQVVYRVSDNGVGSDMAYADRLFGVFQRFHGAEIPGTGIGLAIVKRIVGRHRGRVGAEGAVGGGASFWFTLPTQEREGRPRADAADRGTLGAPAGHDPGNAAAPATSFIQKVPRARGFQFGPATAILPGRRSRFREW